MSGYETGVGRVIELEETEKTVDSHVGGVRLSAMLVVIAMPVFMRRGMNTERGNCNRLADQGMKLGAMRVAVVPLISLFDGSDGNDRK